ncbi:SufD family Fe-S cluster assembly protein [Sphingoaurantiacus capsulatus]|uniref:SufD family Fe-S cluster assembly protein n=1 Tax=Sphingoaurantiacus capsulatus TaxID=1771310 RepID=A0ABV7XAK8_9SPHN
MTLPVRFDDLGLPGRRHEDWRWSDLSAIEAALAARANDGAPDARRWLIDGVTGPVLLFVDGRYSAEGSDPQGVTIETSGGDEAHILSRLTRGAVGATLRLGREQAAGPIQLVHVATGGQAHLHHRLTLAEDAQASIVETYVGAPASWTNVAVDIELAHSARLMRTVRRLGEGGVHTETLRAGVGQGASFMGTTLLTQAENVRIESHARLHGIGAFASLDGIMLGRNRQTFDVVNRIEHAAEGGSSRQTWRSVADDRATLSFAGKIQVARAAQKTDAEQSVKALLMERTATVNSKPELEIFADDVKCAHGATVGELSKDALFYLASRGVPPAESRAILTESFLSDALATIGEDAVREALTADAIGWLRRGA